MQYRTWLRPDRFFLTQKHPCINELHATNAKISESDLSLTTVIVPVPAALPGGCAATGGEIGRTVRFSTTRQTTVERVVRIRSRIFVEPTTDGNSSSEGRGILVKRGAWGRDVLAAMSTLEFSLF